MPARSLVSICVLCLAAAPSIAEAPRFDRLYAYSKFPCAVYCITPDGQVCGGGYVLGGFGGRDNSGPMFWDAFNGSHNPTAYSPGSAAAIRALTPDGHIGVGGSRYDPIAQASGPFVWDLVVRTARGLPRTGPWSTDAANGVNQDATVIVGRDQGRAVAWIGANPPAPLTSSPDSTACAVTPDGSVIVGHFGSWSSQRADAFVWTAASGAVTLPPPVQGATFTRALAITPDGTTIVGYSGNEYEIGSMVRWHRAANGSVTTAEAIAPPASYSCATLVSTGDDFPISVDASGRMVCGSLGEKAVLWTEDNGLLDLAALYDELVPVPPEYDDPKYPRPTPVAATGISADGRTIVLVAFEYSPFGAMPLSWKLTLPPRCDGDANFDGLSDTRDLIRLLGAFGQNVPFGTRGDSNGDGAVDTTDLVRLLAGFGQACPS